MSLRWIFMCSFNVRWDLNVELHSLHLYSSWRCIFWCRNRFFFCVNSFPHVSQQNDSVDASETKWISLLCSSRLFSELNLSEQLLQVKSPFLWTRILMKHTLTKEIVTLQLNQVWGVYVCVNVSYDHETAPSHPTYRSNSQITLISREILVSR